MISKQNFTEPEVAVYIAVRNYSRPTQCGLTLLLDAGIEASACARNSATSASTSTCVSACASLGDET